MTRLCFAATRLWVVPLLLVAGCAPTAAQLMAPSQANGGMARREFQTRLYEAQDEGKVLAVCTALLQDMGFQVDEAASGLGVLSASKTRDANPLSPEERVAISVVSGAAILSFYGIPLGLILSPMADPKPKNIEVGITTRTLGRGAGRVSVDVVFKENSADVTDPTVYQAFFDQLSKALFLEARES